MDEEDFEEDPTRFFSFYNDTDISYSGMDIHATNLLIEMCYRRGKRVIPLLYQCLQDIGTNNPAPTPAESPTVADKYAALRAIGTVSDTLRRRKQFTQHVPYLIQTYVLPEFFSTSPLIRFAVSVKGFIFFFNL